MSRIEQRIVNAWAGKLAARIVEAVIGELKDMEAVLSGDSGLENVWEEICAQVQGEESSDWSAYEDVIESLLHAGVQCMDREAQLALWAVTDQGWDYIDEHHADSNGIAGVPLNTGDIVAKLAGEVLAAAADYESPSLYRYIWGEDDPEYDEDEDEIDEDDDFEDPVIFGINRQQIETFDLGNSLVFLRSLVPQQDPQYAWSWKGALSIAIGGYDDDPRELFEIPEVNSYLQGLDQEWPFWFFFCTPESIRLIGMCLASAVAVAPGKAYLPPENLNRFMERGFRALNQMFEYYGFPESDNEALSQVVSQIFST